jgi:transposase
MALYSAIDLHSTNSYLAIIDDQSQTVLCRRLPNELVAIQGVLEPYRDQVYGVAVESTYNWYWLVDGLKDAGYRMFLVNTSAVKQYEGLKHKDDRHDARWLAELLRLGILPTGYIYPKADRALRDLLRRRSFLVRQTTANLLSAKNVYTRQTGERIKSEDLKRWDPATVADQVADPYVGLSLSASTAVMAAMHEQISIIEKEIKKVVKLRDGFKLVKTVPGVGDILGLTIMFEVGEIGRFARVGDFVSYCRHCSSSWLSNGKQKGSGNKKNGNPYLAWAFSEAAVPALRSEPRVRRWYDRKSARSKPIVARSAVATKLARGTYYVLRDQVPFDVDKAFG